MHARTSWMVHAFTHTHAHMCDGRVNNTPVHAGAWLVWCVLCAVYVAVLTASQQKALYNFTQCLVGKNACPHGCWMGAWWVVPSERLMSVKWLLSAFWHQALTRRRQRSSRTPCWTQLWRCSSCCRKPHPWPTRGACMWECVCAFVCVREYVCTCAPH